MKSHHLFISLVGWASAHADYYPHFPNLPLFYSFTLLLVHSFTSYFPGRAWVILRTMGLGHLQSL